MRGSYNILDNTQHKVEFPIIGYETKQDVVHVHNDILNDVNDVQCDFKVITEFGSVFADQLG